MDLAAQPKGLSRIKVTVDVELEGKTTILAEEVRGDGIIGSSNSVELKDIIGNELDGDDVSAIVGKYSRIQSDEEAEESENTWAGEEAQGSLPL